MEVILSIATISASELYRRKFFLFLAALLGLEFVALSYLVISSVHIGELVSNETPAMLIENVLIKIFIAIDKFGGLLFLILFCTLLPGERRQRTFLPILAKPLHRWQFFLGKYCGGVIIIIFFTAGSLSLLALVQYQILGGITDSFWQTTGLMFVKFLTLGALAMMFTVRFSSWGAGILAFLIFNIPLYHKYLKLVLGKETGDYVHWLFYPLPRFDLFETALTTSHRLVIVWDQYLFIISYVLVLWTAILLGGMLWFESRDLKIE